MDAYMKEHGATEADLAAIAVQEYANARHNPNAMFPMAISIDKYDKAAAVAPPAGTATATASTQSTLQNSLHSSPPRSRTSPTRWP